MTNSLLIVVTFDEFLITSSGKLNILTSSLFSQTFSFFWEVAAGGKENYKKELQFE